MEAILDYIVDQPNPQQSIMEYLHELLASYPKMTGKIRYKIPFYYQRSWICYLNPLKKERVELCFIRGIELSNEQGLLDPKDRKQVSGITFSNVKDIPRAALIEVIEEAILLDEMVSYPSKNRSKNKS